MESGEFDPQLTKRVKEILDQDVFRHQGFVTSTWRNRHGRRFGPYFTLVHREYGRVRKTYLGTCTKLAEMVRRQLRELQVETRRDRQLRELVRKLRHCVRASKVAFDQSLAEQGLQAKGFEVRGWRKIQDERYSKHKAE
jgi:hypothetical protein